MVFYNLFFLIIGPVKGEPFFVVLVVIFVGWTQKHKNAQARNKQDKNAHT
jgi:hypothetical protein